MIPIRTLLDQTPPASPPILPHELLQYYGGDLVFPGARPDRPYVIGNFVASLDGIVSYRIPGKAGGGEISGRDEGDRFVMGLLRASADAVMVGAGTLDATARGHSWIAEAVYRDASDLYQNYRRTVLGKPEAPPTIIVTASGVVDLDRPMFRTPRTPVRLITSAKGRDRLVAAGAEALPATNIIALEDSGGIIPPESILQAVHDMGVRLLLHEGGPTLFGQFVAAGLVDEFFLTVAPQITGCRVEHPRPTMVWGTEFVPETAPWVRVLSVKQSGDLLYLRYAPRGSGS